MTVVAAHASVLFEAHLMVEQPDELAARYVEAGCGLLIVHAEACLHLHRTLGYIVELGATERCPSLRKYPNKTPTLKLIILIFLLISYCLQKFKLGRVFLVFLQKMK